MVQPIQTSDTYLATPVFPSASQEIWDQINLGEALSQFTRASNLNISVYDPAGVRRIGPVISHPLAYLMEDAGGWLPNGQCNLQEIALAKEVLRRGEPVTILFEDSLSLYGFPLEFQNLPLGVMVVGWTFDQFADPIRCAKISRKLGIAENTFWITAREIAPTSRERFGTYVSLLKTMVGAILGQQSIMGELKRANRIKDQFLATTSHELKTPLTSMLLKVQILRRSGVPTKEQLSKGLDVIERGIQTQKKLVDDLLESSRVTMGKMRLDIARVYPNELVQLAVDTVNPAAEAKGVQISLQMMPLGLKYEGDPLRLQQVCWNILNNAVKFTPSGGFVSVSVREVKGNFLMEVRDSGKGIEPALLPQVFEPFFQVRNLNDESNSGLGLGLSVAKAILNLHGGNIKAESAGAGQGACFSITLPSVEHAAQVLSLPT